MSHPWKNCWINVHIHEEFLEYIDHYFVKNILHQSKEKSKNCNFSTFDQRILTIDQDDFRSAVEDVYVRQVIDHRNRKHDEYDFEQLS